MAAARMSYPYLFLVDRFPFTRHDIPMFLNASIEETVEVMIENLIVGGAIALYRSRFRSAL